MGGKYSVCARNLTDNRDAVCEYNLSFIKWIFLGIKCVIKYDCVIIGKHGG